MSAKCIACFPWKGKRSGERRISVGVAVEGQLAECAQLEWGERARKRGTEEIPWFRIIWTTILVCCVIPNVAIKSLDFVTTELWLAFIWLSCLYLFFDNVTCLLRCAVLLQRNKDSHRIYKRHCLFSWPVPRLLFTHKPWGETEVGQEWSVPTPVRESWVTLSAALVNPCWAEECSWHTSQQSGGSSRADQLRWLNAAGAAARLILSPLSCFYFPLLTLPSPLLSTSPPFSCSVPCCFLSGSVK